MTPQQKNLMDLLNSGRWICVNEMISTYCVDYRKRLSELRKQGVEMEDRTCENPYHHHKGGSKEWKLKSKVGQLSLL